MTTQKKLAAPCLPSCVAAALLLCAFSSSVPAETAGTKFRKVLDEIDSRCKQEELGPYLNQADPEYRKKVAITSCDILELKPRDWRDIEMVKLEAQPFPFPKGWLATPEGRLAHSIKLPSPHDEAKDIYREGMSSETYFKKLCGAEAGDFVVKAIPNVDGILRMRLPEIGTDDTLRHLYATESTPSLSLGHIQTRKETLGDTFVQPPHGKYQFAESPTLLTNAAKDQRPYRRFIRDAARSPKAMISTRDESGRWINVPRITAEQGIQYPTARYGYTWRGVTRPKDRELGIAGGELIILDTKTGEVLGFRRLFRMTTIGDRGAWWLTAGNCSKQLAGNAGDFIYRVLKPIEG